ncbi:MAG: sulfotransferase family 2 domain-containing protein [Nocardioides sp.]
MPIFAKDGRSVLLIHIPKTGGTSIEDTMMDSGWTRTDFASPRTEPGLYRFRRVPPQHFHADLLVQTLNVRRFDLRFMIVRDPVARFRSEYAMRERDPKMGESGVVEEWARNQFERYRSDPYLWHNHLRPQHEYEVPDTVVRRFEDGLPQALADLVERIGVPVDAPLVHTKKSHTAGRLSSRDVQISDTLAQFLREFYAEDCRRYGY